MTIKEFDVQVALGTLEIDFDTEYIDFDSDKPLKILTINNIKYTSAQYDWLKTVHYQTDIHTYYDKQTRTIGAHRITFRLYDSNALNPNRKQLDTVGWIRESLIESGILTDE